MNSDQLLSVALAACCLFALGASAATLNSSVNTTPDDVIDVKPGSVPLPSDEVSNLKQRVQSKGTSDRRVRRDGDPPETGPKEEQTRSQSTGGADPGGSPERSGDRNAAGRREGTRPVPVDPSLVDRLLSLLRALLEFLLSIVPVLALAGLAAAAIRYRERLRATVARLRDWHRSSGFAGASGGEFVASPANDVEAAWYEMITLVGVDDARTRTPRECASEAVDAGVDPDLVNSITTVFERVTYGGEPVTDQRRERVLRDVRQLRAQTDGGSVR